MARRTASVLCLLLSALSVRAALAQDPPPATEAPAHISLVDGTAVLERDGQVDSDPTSMPLIAGDRIRTQGGRVEVLFVDGSALHLDANTVVDFQSDAVIRLLQGRIRLSIAGPARDLSYRVDAPSAWVQITDPGEYRVSIQGNADVELAVLRGAAELVNEQGRSFIRAGERTFASAGAAPSPPYVYNSASWDAFDRWSEARRDRRLGVSAQYLPSDVRPYASSFDTYGDWRYDQAYGYVWYPRVYAGWRPYYRGRWVSLRPYGWTWIAGDPWGWPTHHYGRWGISAGSWFWIPGRHWGPAWVSWAYATDYVSWCPLGWNNRPVFQIVNVNLFGGRRYSPWDGWTVVPRRHFSGGFVNVRNVASVRIDQRINNTFIVRDAAPETRFAVGRSAPIRSAGRHAVPRGGTPGIYTSDAGTITTGGSSRSESVDQRRPNAARSRSSPPASPTDRQPANRTGDRAVSRERATPDQSVGAPTGNTERRAGDSSESRRTPTSRQPSAPSGTGTGAVTTAPEGAVRAVPRGRQRSATSPTESGVDTIPSSPAIPASPRARERSDAQPVSPGSPSGERVRTRDERSPSYSSPSAPSYPSAPRARQRSEAAPLDPGSTERIRSREQRAPVYSIPPSSPRAPEADRGNYRSNPGYRSAPESGGEYRGRAVPRSDPGPSPPSFRSLPDQPRAPSGPPPSASGPREQRSPGGSDRASGTRQRSGDSQPSGQGARRRR